MLRTVSRPPAGKAMAALAALLRSALLPHGLRVGPSASFSRFRGLAQISSSTASSPEKSVRQVQLLSRIATSSSSSAPRTLSHRPVLCLFTANLRRLRPPGAASSVSWPPWPGPLVHPSRRALSELGRRASCSGSGGRRRETTAPTMPGGPRRDWLDSERPPIGRGFVGRWCRSRKRRRS